jgi:hypothetical protein
MAWCLVKAQGKLYILPVVFELLNNVLDVDESAIRLELLLIPYSWRMLPRIWSKFSRSSSHWLTSYFVPRAPIDLAPIVGASVIHLTRRIEYMGPRAKCVL